VLKLEDFDYVGMKIKEWKMGVWVISMEG